MSGFAALLATDLDGTLVGDPAALARLNAALVPRRGAVGLAYVTGRTLPSTLALIARAGLLPPDAIVAGVGSSIHVGAGWEPDAAWERRMRPGWSAGAVDAAAAACALTAQPAEAQGAFKRSFWVPPAALPAARAGLARELRARGVLARLIYSSDRDLDVVPLRGGKGPATLHLAARLGVDPARVVGCGDSGNDVDLLAACGAAAVVGNAGRELRTRAPAHAYFARAAYAGGVEEALRHFGVL